LDVSVATLGEYPPYMYDGFHLQWNILLVSMWNGLDQCILVFLSSEQVRILIFSTIITPGGRQDSRSSGPLLIWNSISNQLVLTPNFTRWYALTLSLYLPWLNSDMRYIHPLGTDPILVYLRT
jgi:hypothetical protein